MDLIIETDLGHDPDDFFAICYLAAAGVKIRAVTIVPGDPDQVAIAKFLSEKLGLNFPVGASKLDRTKRSSGGVHHEILNAFKCSLDEKPDGLGKDVIASTLESYPDCELFVIGPATNIGNYLAEHPDRSFRRATMQGGFLPYSHHRPKQTIEKFEGQIWVPTFNLNGDRKGGQHFIDAKIEERRFIGKNVCHTVVYDAAIHEKMSLWGAVLDGSVGACLFIKGMQMYLEHHDSKKFHDPTAAVCHLHPEVATWVRGRPVKMAGGWSTELDENGDYIGADINYDALWEHLANFK